MHYDAVCSFYFSVFEKHAAEMTLEELVRNICDGRWRAQVEEYQRLMASGKETEAKKWKRKLPALVVAGRCRGSHAEGNLEGWSGDAMLDVDHPGGQVDEFLALLERTEWVKAAWRSVSYDGLKLVVRVEAENTDEYRLAYAVVAWHVEQVASFSLRHELQEPHPPLLRVLRPPGLFPRGHRSLPLEEVCGGTSRPGEGDSGGSESERARPASANPGCRTARQFPGSPRRLRASCARFSTSSWTTTPLWTARRTSSC